VEELSSFHALKHQQQQQQQQHRKICGADIVWNAIEIILRSINLCCYICAKQRKVLIFQQKRFAFMFHVDPNSVSLATQEEATRKALGFLTLPSISFHDLISNKS